MSDEEGNGEGEAGNKFTPKETEIGFFLSEEKFRKLANQRLKGRRWIRTKMLVNNTRDLQAVAKLNPLQYHTLRWKFNRKKQWVERSKVKRSTPLHDITQIDVFLMSIFCILLGGSGVLYTCAMTGIHQKDLYLASPFLLQELKDVYDPYKRMNAKFTADEIFHMEKQFHDKFGTTGLFFVFDWFKAHGTRGNNLVMVLVVTDANRIVRWTEEVIIQKETCETDYFLKTDFHHELLRINEMYLAIKCRNDKHKHTIKPFGFGDSKADQHNTLYNMYGGLIWSPFTIIEKGNLTAAPLSTEETAFHSHFERIRKMVEHENSHFQEAGHLKKHYDNNKWSTHYYNIALKVIACRINSFKNKFYTQSCLDKPVYEFDRTLRDVTRRTVDFQKKFFLCSFNYTPETRPLTISYLKKTDSKRTLTGTQEYDAIKKLDLPPKVTTTMEEYKKTTEELNDYMAKCKN